MDPKEVLETPEKTESQQAPRVHLKSADVAMVAKVGAEGREMWKADGPRRLPCEVEAVEQAANLEQKVAVAARLPLGVIASKATRVAKITVEAEAVNQTPASLIPHSP